MKTPHIANDCRAAELDSALGRLNEAVAATTTARQTLEQRLAEATLALERTNQRHASKMSDAATALSRVEDQAAAERLAASDEAVQRQAEFDAELMREVTKRQKLAKALSEAAAALETAEQQAAVEAQAAAEHAARCQERFETELRGEVARRLAVEEEFANLRTVSEQVRLGLLDQLTAMRQHEAELEERAARERSEWERTQVEDRQRIQYLQMEGDRARQSLAATEEQIQRLQSVHEEERANLERARIAIETELAALGEELETTRRQRDVLKITADRVPQLHKRIDDSRAAHRHRFANAPVSMFRCSRDGVITQVTQALATLLGYKTPEDLQKVDFAATVFDSGDELQWIVDRCLASRSTESVETTWRRKDGTRVIVRVLGVATTTDSIDLVAQDMTTLREIEEKLRNSQRMEAVARYASEVAVNCDNLLRHVKEEGEQWLPRINSDAARYQAELLLDEVARASGFLRQLAVYGNEQKKIPELVEVNKVLRDMEPVLKRVAGDNIELVLPKAATPLNLDVDAERVERMLVNVAAYGRERMPLGGRLMIEVASVVVDRKFVAKHPNVRPGAHVLLTVNEMRGPVRPDFLAVHTQTSAANATSSAVETPGVDLGALQALVSDCGGHLWMMAEPPGDMVLKIHLPRRVLDHLDPRAAAKPSAGARWITRLPGTWH
jgi:PAS domain S-box-containing protein